MIWRMKDPVSALTHFAGALLSVAGLVLLVCVAALYGSAWHVVSFAIFGVSLILLYSASTIYHWLRASEQVTRALKKVDHMMIFVLIAGTYTPFCLVPLRGAWGWSLFAAIWSIAIGGIFMKLFWIGAPRWLSTLLYTVMGWLVVVASVPLMHTLPRGGFGWLVGGGVVYTVGALIYALKWPNLVKGFGFHEVWHLFVMGGSFCHFWAVFHYITRVG